LKNSILFDKLEIDENAPKTKSKIYLISVLENKELVDIEIQEIGYRILSLFSFELLFSNLEFKRFYCSFFNFRFNLSP